MAKNKDWEPGQVAKERATDVASKGYEFVMSMVPWDENGFAPGRALWGGATFVIIGIAADSILGVGIGLFSPNVARMEDPDMQRGHNVAVVGRNIIWGGAKGTVGAVGNGLVGATKGAIEYGAEGWDAGASSSFAEAGAQRANWAALENSTEVMAPTPQRLPRNKSEVATYVQPD